MPAKPGSFYTAFVTNAALEAYKHKDFGKFILFADDTFEGKKKSTGQLMKEALLKRQVPENE